MFVANLVEGCEHSRLDIKILEHCFDNQIGVRSDVFSPNNPSNSPFDICNFILAEYPPLDGLLEKIRDNRLTACNPMFLAVNHLNLESLLRRFLSDS